MLQFGALNHQCCYLMVRSHITRRISRLFLWSFVSTICSMQCDCIPVLNFHLPFTWKCSEIPLLPNTKCTYDTKWTWGSAWMIQTFLALYSDIPLLYQHKTLLQIFLNTKQQRCTRDKQILELASSRTLSLETNWSFKANNLLCQLENDILHHHKQSRLIFLTHNMHIWFISYNYLNLHCIIVIPNTIIILVHHRSKIKNLPYWNWPTKLSASGKSIQRNEIQNSGSHKHSGCPNRQLMSKQHENLYEKNGFFIVATTLICTSSAMTGNQMHIIWTQTPLLFISLHIYKHE
jgi:hypothetical protein